MSILKNHIQKHIRNQYGDITIFNLSKDKAKELQNLIQESAILEKTENNELSLKTNFDEFKIVRWLFSNATSIGEEIHSITDEELQPILENPDEELKSALRELKEIIKETLFDLQENIHEQVDALHSLIKERETFEKVDEIAKTMNMSVDDLIALSQKQNELNELQKKQLPTPQDHLPKQPSKKRGRPKKADKVVKDTEEVKIEDSQNANS